MRTGTVYTETVVHLAPTRFAEDVPYQVAIVTLEDGDRLTARIAAQFEGDRVAIGDSVIEVEPRNGIPFFRRK
jgi:uncharacterized OB-fold protein